MNEALKKFAPHESIFELHTATLEVIENRKSSYILVQYDPDTCGVVSVVECTINGVIKQGYSTWDLDEVNPSKIKAIMKAIKEIKPFPTKS